MSKITRLIREEIYNLPSYKIEPSITTQIAFHKNENPWNDFRFARVNNLNRYPESQPLELRGRIAEIFDLCEEKILITHGSDEAINSLIKLFCAPRRDSIMVCPPTFTMYEIYAQIQSIKVIKVPLQTNNFSLNQKAIETAMNPHVKLIFICSPNNPTGNLIDIELISILCEKFRHQAAIVVDEAYFEYSNGQSAVDLLQNHENLIVIKTLSKAYGLAAIRCGMTFAHAEIIAWLRKIMPPYPISVLNSAAAQNVLTSTNLLRIKKRINILKNQRQRLIDKFSEFDWVEKVWPSCANFFLVKLKKNIDLKKYCLEKNIVIRDVSHLENLKNCVRISVGRPQDNNYLLKVLGEFRK